MDCCCTAAKSESKSRMMAGVGVEKLVVVDDDEVDVDEVDVDDIVAVDVVIVVFSSCMVIVEEE